MNYIQVLTITFFLTLTCILLQVVNYTNRVLLWGKKILISLAVRALLDPSAYWTWGFSSNATPVALTFYTDSSTFQEASLDGSRTFGLDFSP